MCSYLSPFLFIARLCADARFQGVAAHQKLGELEARGARIENKDRVAHVNSPSRCTPAGGRHPVFPAPAAARIFFCGSTRIGVIMLNFAASTAPARDDSSQGC